MVKAGDAVPADAGLFSRLYDESSLMYSPESLLAAFRLLTKSQFAILVAHYGLDERAPRPVVSLRESTGLTTGQLEVVEFTVVPRLQELLLAQPQTWAGLPDWVVRLLTEVGITRPQHLSPEGVLLIADGLAGRWGGKASVAVNLLLESYGFRSLRQMNPTPPVLRMSAWGSRGL
jgi:hypothetical protein